MAGLADASPFVLDDDICKSIKQSKNLRILVYGLNAHHLELLSSIVGQEIPVDKLQESGYTFHKNGVVVDIHFGQKSSSVSHENVDLLIYFVAIRKDFDFLPNLGDIQVREITEAHGAMIWKHSIVVFSGIDSVAEDLFQKKPKEVVSRLEEKFGMWQSIIKQLMHGVDSNEVLIKVAGKLSQIDLPMPHEKWFSQLWYGCFLQSKDHAMPAILKIAQDRLTYSLKSSATGLCEQSILVNQEGMGEILSIFKSKWAIGGGVGGVAVGALVGLGVLGVSVGTAGAGLVVAGALGTGAGGAFNYFSKENEKTKKEADFNEPIKLLSKEKKQYIQVYAYLPKVLPELKAWAQQQTKCKIVVTGMSGESCTAVPASLTDSYSRESTWACKQVIHCNPETVIEVNCSQNHLFPQELRQMRRVASKVVEAKNNVNNHILLFCIPITGDADRFIYSQHLKALERLYEIDQEIFSKVIFVFTHVDKIKIVYDFSKRFQHWMNQVKKELGNFFNLRKEAVDGINFTAIRYIHAKSHDSEVSPLQNGPINHDLRTFLLKALHCVDISGLPVLLKANRKRLAEHPEEYPDSDNVRKELIEVQCEMFSHKGREQFEEFSGAAIGQILGANESALRTQ